jgi:glutaminase
LAGGKKFEYDNKVYLSEKSQPWSNKAIAYLMMKTGAFPEWITEDGAKVDQALNFYFMLCSLESDADRMSVVAATLANNGICPLTGE